MRKKNKGTTKCDKSTITCNVSTVFCETGIIKCKKKNKRTIEYDKSTVTCDVGTAQCEDSTIKCEEKKRELLNVTKVQLHVMLVSRNVRMVPSYVRKTKRNHQLWQNIVTYDIGTAQCKDGTIKCEKKIKEPPNVTKVQSHVMLILRNVGMIS